MVSKVRSLGLGGLKGYEVSVECYLSSGLPSFDIVGLPDTSVKEARERVRAAIKNCKIDYPVSRITINLAPADMRKGGTLYDLPVLVSILIAAGIIKSLPDDAAFIGELSLTGELRPIPGALPMALSAAQFGITRLYLPADNAPEAAHAADVSAYPVRHINDLLAHLLHAETISPAVAAQPCSVNSDNYDFSDVKGQENVKRALEIAAAGGHNILITGTPGAGKSMLAKRLTTILPDMTLDEMLETTGIHSIAGLTGRDMPIMSVRPFRSPHHSISLAAMAGGTSNPRPGEISLAHNGVLFLDEIPEFPRHITEALRQPLEDGQVTISRATQSAEYPCRFMLVCAMNPCKCGWYGHPSDKCTCTPDSVVRYHERLSGPLLDRIDLYIEAHALEFETLKDNHTNAESSAVIRRRVNKARTIQVSRYRTEGQIPRFEIPRSEVSRSDKAPRSDRTEIQDPYSDKTARSGFNTQKKTLCNAYIGPKEMEKYCRLTDDCTALMKAAFNKLNMTARSYDRTLRVARTIADLDGSDVIKKTHLAEAIQYRPVNFSKRL